MGGPGRITSHAMDAEEMRSRATSYGGVAKAYADYRPGYPDEAVSWLVGTSPGRLLELGAGTGKLSIGLCALGHDVIATDPSVPMLEWLRKAAPDARAVLARAEGIPLRSSSVDVVVAAQCFHWFDQGRALPEIARALRPGGVLALAWNEGDFKVPWVAKVMALIGLSPFESADPVAGSELFATSEHRVFRHWQQFHRDSLMGFAGSSSAAATLAAPERELLLEQVGALYDSYGRGPDGMLMPWKTHCYRARVTGLANFRREGPGDDYDDGLLIDFN